MQIKLSQESRARGEFHEKNCLPRHDYSYGYGVDTGVLGLV